MEFSHIQYVLEQHVGIVTIDRPEVRNALSTEMWKALPVVLDTMRGEGARMILLKGASDTFAAGADLTELHALQNHEQANEFWTAIENCLNYVSSFALPVIAMIDGACVGGGCLLASACDLRYASSTATFAIPVAKLGIILDDASIARLVSTVGDSFARHILFTGMSISASEALAHGLVDLLFEAEDLGASVMRIAQTIARNEPVALAEIKRSLLRVHHNASRNDSEHRAVIVDSYLSPELRRRVEKVLNDLQGHKQEQN